MQFHASELSTCERAFLVPDRVGHRRGAEVVHERRAAKRAGRVLGQPKHARGISGQVAVVGVGTTRYGKLPEHDAYDLGVWALDAALADAGLTRADADGLIVNRIPDYQRFCEIAGISPDYVNITPGQGRFSGIDIETAAALIRDGLASTVALVYGNNGRSAGDS